MWHYFKIQDIHSLLDALPKNMDLLKGILYSASTFPVVNWYNKNMEALWSFCVWRLDWTHKQIQDMSIVDKVIGTLNSKPTIQVAFKLKPFVAPFTQGLHLGGMVSASAKAALDKAAARAARLAESDAVASAAVDGPAEAQVAEPVRKKRRQEATDEELASAKAKSRRLPHGCRLPFSSHDSHSIRQYS